MKILKTIAAVLLACMLSSCAAAETDMNAALERSLARAAEIQIPAANYHKKYYSYYAQPCIGRITATETGNVFAFEGKLFAMNLNVPGILREEDADRAQLLLDAVRDSIKERIQPVFFFVGIGAAEDHAHSVSASFACGLLCLFFS